jgi:hypothetical protein
VEALRTKIEKFVDIDAGALHHFSFPPALLPSCLGSALTGATASTRLAA